MDIGRLLSNSPGKSDCESVHDVQSSENHLQQHAPTSPIIYNSTTSVNENNSSSSSLEMASANGAASYPFKCTFCCCEERVWLSGFQSEEDLTLHLQLHRCQWLIWKGQQRFEHCTFIPKNEMDLLQHVETHLSSDKIPVKRRDGESRILYFCPWQTCTSSPYASKGASNRAHIVNHIRKHVQ